MLNSTIILVVLMNREDLKTFYNMLMDDGLIFGITLNMNDTFGFGCAEDEFMSTFDLEYWMFDLYKKYGYKSFVAYASIKKGIDPIVGKDDKNFIAAKKEINKIKKEDPNGHLFMTE